MAQHAHRPDRRPQTVGGAVYLLMLATMVVALVLIAVGSWRNGLIVLGSALLAGAVARLLIPDRGAGMLGIRRKLVDVPLMLLIGGGLVALAELVPKTF